VDYRRDRARGEERIQQVKEGVATPAEAGVQAVAKRAQGGEGINVCHGIEWCHSDDDIASSRPPPRLTQLRRKSRRRYGALK
jgi:hypothetical protein